jgi:hypothetical protein
LESRNTPPRRSVNTGASRPLLTMSADSASASAAGNGTERRSHVFGVDQIRPPDSVIDRAAAVGRRRVAVVPAAGGVTSPICTTGGQTRTFGVLDF